MGQILIMKTLKWLWIAALLTIGFKLYNLVMAGPRGSNLDDMQSFVGMVLTFALLSAVLIVLWATGRAKAALARRIERAKGTAKL